MAIHLTPEQQQALGQHAGAPVDVIDPATGQEYVLVARAQFDRMRTHSVQPNAACASMPDKSDRLPTAIPQRIADLATPPEVAAEARRIRKGQGWAGQSVNTIEDELKLQYYYGGRQIRCLFAREGPIVVAVWRGDEEDYRNQVQGLSAEQKRKAVVLVPSRWHDEGAEIIGFIHHENQDSSRATDVRQC